MRRMDKSSTCIIHQSATVVLVLLLLAAPLLTFPIIGAVHAVLPTNGTAGELPQTMIPNVTAGGLIKHQQHVVAVGRGRMLAPFQLCRQCRCCLANDRANCSSMPCCFGITCDLPDKPYGVCSFVPKTCDCTSCT